MRRLNRFASDYAGLINFDFEKTVTLLINERDEAFEGERAIRLFQFRTWILFSDVTKDDFVRHAGYIAAVKLLEQLEDDYFIDEEAERQSRQGDEQPAINLNDRPPQTLKRIEFLRRDSKAYRQIYDKLIGERGGLSALLYAPSPSEFDKFVHDRIEKMHIVGDLIDYRSKVYSTWQR